MTLRMNGSTSGYVELDCQATGGNNNIKLPSSNGSANQFLKNGSTAGTLGWSSMVEDSSGRVGIGTTSPNASFSTTFNGNLGIRIQNQDTNNSFINFGVDTGSGIAFLDVDKSGTGTALPLRFATNSAERVRIDTSGRLLVGTSSARSNVGGTTPLFQAETATTSSSASAALSLINNQGAGGAPSAINLGLTRGTAIGGTTKVEATDELGFINFLGSDGTNLIPGARIFCTVDAVTGTNDMPGRLVFATTSDGASSPTERARITNAGSVFIGTTTGTIDSSNSGIRFSADGYTQISRGSGAGAGSAIVEFYGNSGQFRTMGNGNAQNTNGSYTTISDAKLKENIVDANSQWDDVKAIKIRKWNYKAETGHETHRQIGPIAQELEEVCPGLVFQTSDRDADGNETGEVTKGVNQSVLYMKAVKALQEAMERIETLEASNADLAARLTALEAA